MLALLAVVVFAQSHVSLQIGKEKQDSIEKVKRDSIAILREQRRDSLRARARARDSIRKEIRLAKKLPVTPAVLATAFKDPRAGELLLRAREARLTQDSSLTGYDANAYERMSVGMGFKRIGRDRLLMRSERASHVMWQRGKGAIIDVKGQRSAFPMLDGVGKGDIDLGSAGAGLLLGPMVKWRLPDLQVAAAAVSASTLRVSVLGAATEAPPIPLDGALVDPTWSPDVRLARAGSRTVAVGAFRIQVEGEPLQIRVGRADGRRLQDLAIDTVSGALSFALGDGPLLGMGQGGPQFDRRGSAYTMRSGQGGYQLRTHGGRVPIQWLASTDGWGFRVVLAPGQP